MKKLNIILLYILTAVSAQGFVNDGFPREYNYNYDSWSNRIYISDNGKYLETAYGIKVFLRLDESKTEIPVNVAAQAYYAMIKKEPEDKLLLIWFSRKSNQGAIILSDNIKTLFPEKYVLSLQNDVLNGLMGNKWYAPEQNILAKILGGFIYMLEKTTMSKAQLENSRDRMIIVDDPLYRMSLVPMVDDAIRMCYAEPISFIFYFPFVMYFLMVRWIGMQFGRKGFYISTAAWAGCMFLMAILIMGRINIYFPYYLSVFFLVSAINMPLYTAAYVFYRDRIENAAFKYLEEISGGGFDKLNSFEGKKWESK